MVDPAIPSMAKPSVTRCSTAPHRGRSGKWNSGGRQATGMRDYGLAILSIGGEDQNAERRQVQAQRMSMAMHRMRFCMNLAGIADTTAAVFHRVSVDALAIPPGLGHPD